MRPTHTSHGPQALRVDVTGVHGWHAAGSATVFWLQVPTLPSADPIHTNLPLPAGSSQQPKLSQPFGVSGPQYEEHVVDCVVVSSAQLADVPAIFTAGSYAQRLSPLGG